MDQHSIPRQITTFEFKLIGFLTIKQFLYLVICAPLAFIIIKLFPIPLVNYLLGAVIVLFGLALAFIPINDRPFDVWIRNLTRRLFSPTQFIYKKSATSLYFLQDLYFVSDPHQVITHIESKQKLAAYLAGKAPVINQHKQEINSLLINQAAVVSKPVPALFQEKKPFLYGSVKNRKDSGLPGILVYVKDDKGTTLRLLKTNLHGIFATFSSLPPLEYLFEFKDPVNRYFFDTIKVKVGNINPKPFEFHSKEIL